MYESVDTGSVSLTFLIIVRLLKLPLSTSLHPHFWLYQTYNFWFYLQGFWSSLNPNRVITKHYRIKNGKVKEVKGLVGTYFHKYGPEIINRIFEKIVRIVECFKWVRDFLIIHHFMPVQIQIPKGGQLFQYLNTSKPLYFSPVLYLWQWRWGGTRFCYSAGSHYLHHRQVSILKLGIFVFYLRIYTV